MKYALILNSSIIVKKPFFSKDKIKLEYGSNRIVSYEKGFEALLDKNIYKFFDDVILIDNTISKAKHIPKNIFKLLPSKTILLLSKNNTYGKQNKGAGMLDSLNRHQESFLKYDFIFYFEPRLQVQTTNFIIDFIKSSKNMFSIESPKRVKTGYFGSKTEDFIDFINSHSVDKLINDNLHIEQLMYDHYFEKDTSFTSEKLTLWKNYLSEIYEKY